MSNGLARGASSRHGRESVLCQPAQDRGCPGSQDCRRPIQFLFSGARGPVSGLRWPEEAGARAARRRPLPPGIQAETPPAPADIGSSEAREPTRLGAVPGNVNAWTQVPKSDSGKRSREARHWRARGEAAISCSKANQCSSRWAAAKPQGAARPCSSLIRSGQLNLLLSSPLRRPYTIPRLRGPPEDGR